MIERITAAEEAGDEQEREIEETLRPRDFSSYVGQEPLKDHLRVIIEAAKGRGEPVEHILLYGPPGLGKTTMAGVIGAEMGAAVRATSGPAIERAGDLASLLTNLGEGDILFIDEIHRLPRTVEEVLYPAMEDFHLDVMLGKGPTAKSIRLDLPRFTIVGATTRAGALSAPFRDRFGLVHRLDYYNEDEIVQILKRAARILGVQIAPEAAAELAKRSRLTPRVANRLLKRVRDYAQVEGAATIEGELARDALALLEIDALGLDAADRRILNAIIEHYGGGPVGVETIAAMCSEERSTIEDVHEPYLMRIGFLERTRQGRKATPKAYLHLGVEPPKTDQTSLL